MALICLPMFVDCGSDLVVASHGGKHMRILAGLALALVVAGCAEKPKFKSLAVSPYIDGKVATAAEEKSYASLYPRALEGYARGTATLRNPVTATGALLVTTDGRFNGTVEEFVKLVASKVGYSVRASGERSGAAIHISVQMNGYPLIGVLQEGFGQAKHQARLDIDQAEKVMTVHYIRRERSPVPHLDDTRL